MRNAFVDQLCEIASQNSDLMLLTGDLGYNVFEKFEERFPKQYINCGVAEQNMVGLAAGLASEQKKVFVYSIANFSTFRCLEQIRNDICYHKFPVTVVSVGTGFSYGTLGYTHYAVEDITVMRSLPGMRILSPADPNDVVASMRLIMSSPSPTYLRLGKTGEANISKLPSKDIDKLNIVFEGVDNLIITTGSISSEVKQAADALNKYDQVSICFGILTQLKPLKLDLGFIKKFKKIITIEEHTLLGGLGSIINDFVLSNSLDARVLNIGLEDIIHDKIGSTEYMRKSNNISKVDLIDRILNFIVNKTKNY
jgi:transketolase